MQLVPASVGEASRSWDDRHLSMSSAAELIGGAGSSGFTSNVSGNASRFLSTWNRHVEVTGDSCEAQAEALRTVIRDFLATDQAVFDDYVALGGFVEELR